MASEDKTILGIFGIGALFFITLIGGAMLTDTAQTTACIDAGMQVIGGSCVQKVTP